MTNGIRIFALLLLLLQVALSNQSTGGLASAKSGGQCDHQIVQSMPEGLDLNDPPDSGIIATHDSLINMVESAKRTLRVASFYWWLTPPAQFDGRPSSLPGRMLMDAITRATARGVQLEVVLDKSGRKDMNNPDDVEALKKIGKVKFLNMTRLLHSGVVHSKFMIADNETLYVGSSNFDWRSYLQIKEIGITFKRCPDLAQDLDKIFRTYMLMADSERVPSQLSADLRTQINLKSPYVIEDHKFFLAASPPSFNGANDTTGRTDDIVGLLHVLEKARHRIDISVMNYSPRVEFVWPHKYWPRIDDALRRAAIERRVQIRLLFSNWTDSKPIERAWYRSLNAIQSPELRGGGIHVKLFQVPAFNDFQKSIPFARVKHDKYMVTESGLYIGTSNWTPDYFISTCGVGVVIEPTVQTKGSGGTATGVIKVMQEVFERDFNSQYAHELD